MSTNYEFKKIGDVDVIESINDFAHVIIEDSGVLKKMAAKNIGAVKTVNGAAPDADGNVQIEVNGGVSSWNNLTDKPFSEEVTTRQLVDAVTVEITNTKGMNLFPVAFEIVDGGLYTVTFNEVEYQCTSFIIEDMFCIGNPAIIGLEASENNEPFLFADVSRLAGEPATGIFVDASGTYTVSIIATALEIKKLDSKFIPVLKGENLSADVMTIDWNYERDSAILSQPYIINKPISKKLIASFEWDGDTTDKELIDVADMSGSGKYYSLCKISDDTSKYIYQHNGGEYEKVSVGYPGYGSGTNVRMFSVKGADGTYFQAYSSKAKAELAYNIELIDAVFVQKTVVTPWNNVELTPGFYVMCTRNNDTGLESYIRKFSLYEYNGCVHSEQLPKQLYLEEPYCNFIYMKSSESKKIYKITVDDSGTLTATPQR